MNTKKFSPGQSGNPAGRPKGSRNKVGLPIKQEIETFLTEQWPIIKRDFKKLEPAARMQHYLKLLQFILPQPKQTDLSIDFTQLSEQQIDQIVAEILNSDADGK